LEDAIYRRVGTSVSPVPLKLNADEALTGQHDADLVRIEAHLLNRVKHGDEQLMVLQGGNSIFNAYLADSTALDMLASLRNGSRVALTGICVAHKEENWNPSTPPRIESFRLLLRTPLDITVIQQPSWWTLPRLLWTLVILGLIVLASFAWVLALRKRVREQMGIIEQKVPQLNPCETLSLDFRQHIFLIFKESLTNIVKHADATRVEIIFSQGHGSKILTIQDNGSGFDAQATTSGTGLKALRRRAARLGGTLEVISKPGQGTTTCVRIGNGPPA
jgi:hypothetical protein